MDPNPKRIETKTSPFALPAATTNGMQTRTVKTMTYSTGRSKVNFFYVFVSIFVVVATGMMIYVLISLSNLQNITREIAISYPTTVQVNDTTNIPLETWSTREFKINNNVVWNIQIPDSFKETIVGATDGTNILNGTNNGDSYKLILSFPLFTNYPNGTPADLKTWVEKELTFVSSDDIANVSTESFVLSNNLQATYIKGMKEIISDTGAERTFGTNKTIVLYVGRTKTRNFSKITLIPQGTYNEESATALMERIASSLKF